MKNSLLCSILIHVSICCTLIAHTPKKSRMLDSVLSEIEVNYSSNASGVSFLPIQRPGITSKVTKQGLNKTRTAQTKTMASEKETDSTNSVQTNLSTESGAAGAIEFNEYRPSPQYPREALEEKLEGNILIEVETDLTGYIKEIKLIQGSGHPVLDEEALGTIKKWRLRPVKIIRIPISFHLNS